MNSIIDMLNVIAGLPHIDAATKSRARFLSLALFYRSIGINLN